MTGRKVKVIAFSFFIHVFILASLGLIALSEPMKREDDKIYDTRLMEFSRNETAERALNTVNLPSATMPAYNENPPENESYQKIENTPQTKTVIHERAASTPTPSPAPTSDNTANTNTVPDTASDTVTSMVATGISGNVEASTSNNGNVGEPPAPPPVATGIVQPATAPVVVSGGAPKYPYAAQQDGIEGTVVVRFLLNKSGGVDDVSVSTSSGNSSLDRAALNAAKNYRFSPGLDEYGRPVRCYAYKPFTFRLQ